MRRRDVSTIVGGLVILLVIGLWMMNPATASRLFIIPLITATLLSPACSATS